jgi:two-component system nitrate/nitrite response regulator NarL
MRILLVEDHALFREGLKFLLRGVDAALELDEAGTCAEALQRVAAVSYDLVLLDLTMPGRSGLDALTALRQAVPETAIVVLSGEEDQRTIRGAIERGAMGFIPKASTPNTLVQALRPILAGGVYLPATALDDGCDISVPSLPAITPRQMEVLRCIVKGKPNKVIARELGIADDTVKRHVSAVLSRLGVRNRTEAVYVTAKLGLRLA